MFHISPVSKPRDLERILHHRGYRTNTPTLTCIASTVIARASLPEPREVRASGEPDDDFAQLVQTGSRSEAVLIGQRALPKKLGDSGGAVVCPDVASALAAIAAKP